MPRVMVTEMPCFKCGAVVPIAPVCSKCGAPIAKSRRIGQLIAIIGACVFLVFCVFGAIVGSGQVGGALHSNNSNANMFVLLAVAAVALGLVKLGWSFVSNAFAGTQPSDRKKYMKLAKNSLTLSNRKSDMKTITICGKKIVWYHKDNEVWNSKIGWEKTARLFGMALASGYEDIDPAWETKRDDVWHRIETHNEISPATKQALRDLMFVELLTDITQNSKAKNEHRHGWFSVLANYASDSPELLEAGHIIAADWNGKEQRLVLKPEPTQSLISWCRLSAPSLVAILEDSKH